MRHRARSILAVGTLLIGGASVAPIAQAQPAHPATSDTGEVKVFHAEVTKAQVPLLLAAGQDGHELGELVPDRGTATVEVYLTEGQAGKLEKQGVDLTERTLSARAESRVEDAAEGVFRPYSGKGGLKEEILRTARENPGLTKVVSIGRTVRGQDILALKLTKKAGTTKDGSRPSVLYMSNQHAREWITPEMTRRLMHHYLDHYRTDKRIKKIVDTTELWFVLSANPDGYDYTFADKDNRLWRKNLRDVNGDGAISTGDGVDLNRNFSYKWGYDDEGSSPNPTSQTYRGATPAPSRRPRPSTPSRSASASRTASTTTPPPNSSSTESAGRWPPPPPTTSSTRRWPARPTTRRSPATIRSSPPSCTPPTARPTDTRPTSTAWRCSPPRCRRARPCPRPTRTTSGTPPTASRGSTSPTTRS
ncbi:hypothetical protein SHKM778_69420 [Streptomyces sp. KM77-8]|uniref:Peptidase M14 domain-containing protein n=1 Tax=Streptomyces haneummycinicus TaxID=3074435 RepID=A0AAT9HT41_9ACTN